MGVRRVLVLALAGVAVLAAPSAAQDAAADRCRSALLARPNPPTRIIDPCHELAVAAVSDRTSRYWVSPRDVQSGVGGSAAPAGSPAQGSAVPSTMPTALAATTVAAVAHDSGTTTITAISLNPMILFSASGDPLEIARLSRLLDITLFVPVDGLDEDDDGRIDYAGARLRINLMAGSQSHDLLDRLSEAVRAEMDLASLIEPMLIEATDPGRCVASLNASEATTAVVTESCDGPLPLRVDEARYTGLRAAMREAREAADARYLGLDLRVDTGDPVFGTAHHAPGTSLVAAVAAGRRITDATGGASTGIRGRVGARYVTLRDTTVTDWQLDGGLAFEASRPVEDQRIELSLGLEFRFSGNRTSAEVLRTRYAEIRGGITVPIAGASAVVVSLSAPIWGDVSPTLSVSGNWRQLLGALSGS